MDIDTLKWQNRQEETNFTIQRCTVLTGFVSTYPISIQGQGMEANIQNREVRSEREASYCGPFLSSHFLQPVSFGSLMKRYVCTHSLTLKTTIITHLYTLPAVQRGSELHPMGRCGQMRGDNDEEEDPEPRDQGLAPHGTT